MNAFRTYYFLFIALLLSTVHPAMAQTTSDSSRPQGAFYTGEYINMFQQVLQVSQEETNQKLRDMWNHFFGNGKNKVYYEVGDDMAYIYDVNSRDVRSEGVSYGMMICVQMDKQKEFDKIWRWVKRYMLYTSGRWKGYFAWHCYPDGRHIGHEPSCASDGEIYFITSLFFAAHRWGNDGEFNYEQEAQDILYNTMSKDGSQGVLNLFDAKTKLVTFVPNTEDGCYTDPSYNLPAFFELWALWSKTNKEFWEQTPAASRQLLVDSSHPKTGLFPDYSAFDGTPLQPSWKRDYDARRYQYDAIRCAMNIGMDYYWFGKDRKRQEEMMTRLLTFVKEDGYTHSHFDLDGSHAMGEYDEGRISVNAVGSLALTDKDLQREYIERLWNVPFPSGHFRYYNGMLYMMSMLHVSGNFRIY